MKDDLSNSNLNTFQNITQYDKTCGIICIITKTRCFVLSGLFPHKSKLGLFPYKFIQVGDEMNYYSVRVNNGLFALFMIIGLTVSIYLILGLESEFSDSTKCTRAVQKIFYCITINIRSVRV